MLRGTLNIASMQYQQDVVAGSQTPEAYWRQRQENNREFTFRQFEAERAGPPRPGAGCRCQRHCRRGWKLPDDGGRIPSDGKLSHQCRQPISAGSTAMAMAGLRQRILPAMVSLTRMRSEPLYAGWNSNSPYRALGRGRPLVLSARLPLKTTFSSMPQIRLTPPSFKTTPLDRVRQRHSLSR